MVMRALKSAGAVFVVAMAVACIAPRAEPTPTAAPTEVRTADPDAEIHRVVELRQDWGLRSDEQWVRQVTVDPAAMPSILGVPLMPDEVEQLEETFREDPRSRLIAYGYGHPDQYAGGYVDNQGTGPFVLLFTGNLDSHRAALEALPGDYPFEVKPAQFPESELKAVMNELIEQLRTNPNAQLLSVALDTIGNRVLVEAKSNDPTLESVIEATHPGMVEAAIYPLPGPWANRLEGDGWRLLAAGILRGGGDEAYRVHAATNDADWQILWRIFDPTHTAPTLDSGSQIAVAFADGVGSSCPELRLDDVVIDVGARAIYSVTSDPLAPRGCTADLMGAAYFVVALDRSALPESPFTVRLWQDSRCGGEGCAGHSQEVVVDLQQ